MKYLKAEEKDLEEVYELIQKTIKAIYPKYYPVKVVDFFCFHHRKENILRDIKDGNVYLLKQQDRIIGTVTTLKNEINRFFILPEYQHKGYGILLLEFAEGVIKTNYYNALLDASLPGAFIYERAGYKTINHNRIVVEDEFLVYEIMEKKFF